MQRLLWVAALLLLVAAIMLIAEIGAPSLWIAVITIAIALAVVGAKKPSNKAH